MTTTATQSALRLADSEGGLVRVYCNTDATEEELGDAIAELEATHVILWDQGPEVDAGGGGLLRGVPSPRLTEEVSTE